MHKIIKENPNRVSILVPTKMQTHFLECCSSNAHFNRLHTMTSGIRLATHYSRDVGLVEEFRFFPNFPGFAFWTSDFGDICWTYFEFKWPLYNKVC